MTRTLPPPTAHRREQGWPRVRSQAGSTTVTVLVFPLLITMIMLVVQFSLAYHAKAVLTAAAQDATRATEMAGGDLEAGRTEAAAVVADNAATLVDDVDIDVTVSPDGEVVTTRISGNAVSLVPIPGLQLRVTGNASGPVERFRPERTP